MAAPTRTVPIRPAPERNEIEHLVHERAPASGAPERCARHDDLTGTEPTGTEPKTGPTGTEPKETGPGELGCAHVRRSPGHVARSRRPVLPATIAADSGGVGRPSVAMSEIVVPRRT